jgi:hypothetical protein
MNISEVAETGASDGAFSDSLGSVFEASSFAFAPRFTGVFFAAFSTTSAIAAGALATFLAGAFFAAGFVSFTGASVITFFAARERVGFFSTGTFESSFFTISGALQAA